PTRSSSRRTRKDAPTGSSGESSRRRATASPYRSRTSWSISPVSPSSSVSPPSARLPLLRGRCQERDQCVERALRKGREVLRHDALRVALLDVGIRVHDRLANEGVQR